MLRDRIDAVAPGTMVIAEEYSRWADSSRRIDLLCLDQDANLIVIELKRDTKGGHMDLQALRYAAMVAPMTFEQLVDAHEVYLAQRGDDPDQAEERILEFLDWDDPGEQEFGGDVRIVLVASDFSTELTSSVLWLNERQLDIRCVRLSPHKHEGKILFAIEQCIPIPEAEDYQVQIQTKAQSRRLAGKPAGAPTGYWFVNVGEERGPHRSWDDCKRYGYISAGGSQKSIDKIRRLTTGVPIFAYMKGKGYVGVGRVRAEAVPLKEFTVDNKPLLEMDLVHEPNFEVIHDLDRTEWCVAIEWAKTLDRDKAVGLSDFRRGTACEIRQHDVVQRLLDAFGINEAEI